MSRRELLFGKKSPANEFRSGGFPAAKHLKPKPTSIRKAGTLSFGRISSLKLSRRVGDWKAAASVRRHRNVT
jgi:hypothetical protein